MKNPNRYGTISKLSGARRRPYMVREGLTGKQKVIGYAATKEEAMKILADFNHHPWDMTIKEMTLGSLFDLFLEKRASRYSATTVNIFKSAYNYIIDLERLPYRHIKAFDMQETIDKCQKSYSTKNSIRSLWVSLDRLAMEMDIIDKSYASLLRSEETTPAERKPFTDEEIQKVWDANYEFALVLLYTGFRISELLRFPVEKIDLEMGTMQGGVKTKAGKDRIVPIHHRIYPIIEKLVRESKSGKIFDVSQTVCRRKWDDTMRDLGMDHVPHECRHTFRSKLDSAGANRTSIDLLMGHKSPNVGERVYTHKTIEELRTAIELIP